MISDESLRAAATRSCEIYAAHLEKGYDPENQHVFSPEFEKKIKKLKRMTDHPVFYRSMQRVASIVLVILIVGGIFITFNAEARAAFVRWVKEIYEIYFAYRFDYGSSASEEPVDYCLTLIPDGYTEFYSDKSEDTVSVIYANKAGEMLKFNYARNPDQTSWFVGTDYLTIEQITINGVPAELVTSTETGAASAIMWVTEDNTAFNVSGFLTVEELTAVAESVQAIESN